MDSESQTPPSANDPREMSITKLVECLRSAYPFALRDRCISVLEAKYVGLRFAVDVTSTFGGLQDLSISIRGSREALVHHEIVSTDQFSQIPKSGVTQKFSDAGIWRIAKLKQRWSIQLSTAIGCDGLAREFRECAASAVPGLETWLVKRAAAWQRAVTRFWSAERAAQAGRDAQNRAVVLTHARFSRSPVDQTNLNSREGGIDLSIRRAQALLKV